MKCRNRVRKDEFNVVVFEDLGAVYLEELLSSSECVTNRNFMDKVDKSWMHLLRWTDEYIRGVNDFLDKAFERASQGNEILCPCQKYINRNWHYRNVVEDHLVVNGFVDGYTEWVFHGEGFSSRITPHQSNNDEGSNMHDDIDGLLHDTFRNIEGESVQEEGTREDLSEDAKRFFKLLEEGKQELYPRCENFSKLSFTIRLYLFKSLYGLSNVAFSDLLELLKEAFPLAKLPEFFNKAKNMIKDLGLHYEKIHAYPNDCMLFWNDNAKVDNCSVCGSSRWKRSNYALNNTSSKVPAKVLRYFPLKPRLQRIFMCPEIAIAMRWHTNERPNDGNLRHPADGEASKDFDSLHPDFSKDPRNVRLGLSSDGFNPFRTMSISHSTWPVMLMNYNLSPWICMKPEYIMLSMIIPGPSSPGNDIDVYLQPLIAELKELWETGIETYDAETKQTFQMCAALLWTISDFPALAMLSGWSTKGRKKSKDHVNARYDLKEMGIREELQPREDDDGSVSLAKACFYMEPKQKSLFCTVIKNAKLPKGYASNISERVQVKEMKISGYKSHDAHFIMHYLLQVAVRKELPKSVSLALIRLGNIFRAICSKVIRRRDLEKMTSEIVEINCELEKIFHPTFFDIMPHLPIHLVNEIKLGGPAHLRWMYPIERNLCKYKAFVRNRSCPEASIAEGFLAEECHPIGSKKKNTFLMDPQLCYEEHQYALFNTGDEQVETFIECDWFRNELDEYGLTRVYFKKLCSTDDPFLLASQVYQVFYVEDPIEKDVYYTRNKVPVDLYDLEEENCPNIEDAFWREPNDDVGSLSGLVDVEFGCSRNDVPVDVVDIPSNAQHSHDTIIETSEEENEFDDTDWDWMESDD
ncbi:uncharacterized protein LOC107798997 [Nicotiana tabacum]|uniref:Uncharacterized protein LOC107798997 n=1 Tax=Nicotiana tabacum TaxID=4097 RepID=A0AC58S620_TOBAC